MIQADRSAEADAPRSLTRGGDQATSLFEYLRYLTYSLETFIVGGMSRLEFESYTQARAHLKELLDVAARGGTATVRRDDTHAAVVDAERLRVFLATVCPARAEVVAEAGSWWAFIPGVPVSADGATFDEAVTEMIGALREYADDWLDHLADVPGHRENWGLVQLVDLSDDEQLRSWLLGPAGAGGATGPS